MKNYYKSKLLFFVLSLFLIVACQDDLAPESENSNDNINVIAQTKAQKLAAELFKEGAVISADKTPKIINASEVLKSLNDNVLLLDIRGAKDFSSGHIKNAINVKMSELIDFAQAKGLPMYSKVIMICYTGQSATYSAAVLQMLGYDNIYVLDWGMSSWNSKFSGQWEKNTSDIGIEKLVKTPYNKNSLTELPEILDTKNAGVEIIYSRARKILEDNFGSVAVSYNYAVTNADANQAYVISYQPEEIYNEGHINNAVLFNQENSFNLSTDLLTLPTDKTIVVYSNKAYQSTFITAYLKMLGYNAKTLKFGANSFMKSKLKSSGEAFSKDVIKNYSYETSKYIEVVEEVQTGGC